jgi:flagellar biosynthetic protein FliR
MGFQLAFPFLITLFLTNLILALINRLIPQINVFIVGLPFQIFVGLFALFLGFFVVVYYFVNLSEYMNAALMEILKIWSR